MIIIFLIITLTTQSLTDSSRKASFTYYTSYAKCCKDNPNYDENANTTECDVYSACDYSGEFAAIGHKSYEYVQKNNLIAFYDSSDPNGDNFYTKYGGKKIKLTKGSVTITAIIADTCFDSDCDGCCTANAQPSGYLIDMEYWTAVRNFGSVDVVDGQINFVIEAIDIWIYVVAAVSVLLLIIFIAIAIVLRKKKRKKNKENSPND